MADDFGLGNLAGTNFNAPSGIDFSSLTDPGSLGSLDYSGVNSLSDSYNFGDLSDFGLSDAGFGTSLSGLVNAPAQPQSFTSRMNDFFSKNPFGRIANVALNFTPVGRAFNVGRGIAGALQTGNTMGAATAAMGAAPGPVGMVGNFLNAANSGKGGNLAGMFGGMVGNAVTGNQLGGLAGSTLANQFSNMQPGGPINSGGTSNFNQAPGGEYGLEQGISDAMKLYAMGRGSSGYGAAKDANAAIQGQISQLSNMFGPNSPYAQQLRQQLERKDAAAGRRSQYGPREVQLQAMLADKAAQTAGTIGNLAQQSQTQSMALKNARDQQRAQQLAMLFKMGQGSGAFRGLQDMFNDASGATPFANSVNYGNIPDMNIPMGGNVLSNPGALDNFSLDDSWMTPRY